MPPSNIETNDVSFPCPRESPEKMEFFLDGANRDGRVRVSIANEKVENESVTSKNEVIHQDDILRGKGVP